MKCSEGSNTTPSLFDWVAWDLDRAPRTSDLHFLTSDPSLIGSLTSDLSYLISDPKKWRLQSSNLGHQALVVTLFACWETEFWFHPDSMMFWVELTHLSSMFRASASWIFSALDLQAKVSMPPALISLWFSTLLMPLLPDLPSASRRWLASNVCACSSAPVKRTTLRSAPGCHLAAPCSLLSCLHQPSVQFLLITLVSRDLICLCCSWAQNTEPDKSRRKKQINQWTQCFYVVLSLKGYQAYLENLRSKK